MAIEDQIEYFMFDHDKHMFSGRSGKQRTKRETTLHTNRFDPNGHSRKLIVKIRNTEMKRRLPPIQQPLSSNKTIVQQSSSLKNTSKGSKTRLVRSMIRCL
ncbi:p8 nuclear protein-like protein [Euroglyphus maynei]|uniref:p8 nuclear protein-like protein n=1 Tax=Euroglyphus maynei TaxID=6958 RepID=A0A1Y3ALD6_EURMA|nr:p8 nuclear protein-like protein [Euroglyphus maynei]